MTASPSIALDIREVSSGELDSGDLIGWILNSWLRSTSDAGRGVGHGAAAPVYWTEHERLARLLCARSRVVLATLPQSPDVYVGWACGGGGVLHYCYTKRSFRRAGVATRLLGELGGAHTASHAPAPHRRWMSEWLSRVGCTVRPYVLIAGMEDRVRE